MGALCDKKSRLTTALFGSYVAEDYTYNIMQTNQDYVTFASQLAREAGKIITEYFFNADRSDIQQKSNKTLVTEADIQINQLVIDRLQAAYPEHGVLGEEQSYEADRRELWVCDPIDGTHGLTQGVPTALFSLAYVVDGVPQAAVMFDPFQDLLFSAVRGGGAFCNGRQVRVSDRRELTGATVGITASYAQARLRQATYDWLAEQDASLLMVPGNVFKSGLLTRGLIDGYIFPGRSAHDIAAAALIVAEAGGRVTDLDGHEQRYDGTIRGAIISNGHIHDTLVEAVAKLGSEQFLGY